MNYSFRLSGLSFALLCLMATWAAAQTPTPTPTATPTPDPFVVQITSAAPVASPTPGLADVNAFVGDVSGDGRFVVFESRADLATLAPTDLKREPVDKFNADGNREIFLWDAAQRRIFQITKTQSALVDNTKSSFDNTNIAVEVSNNRPQLSRDGKFIVFSSNANTPGNFDGTTTAAKAALQADGNQELFIYRIPDVPAADLTSGTDPGYFDLSAGTFTRITNTAASALPRAGSANAGPFVADDNRFATINDTGSRIAFVSTRDLTPCNSTNTRCNSDGNPEVFVWNRLTNAFLQITVTSGDTIFNDTPSISGGTSGSSSEESPDSFIAFYSNAKTLPDIGGTNAAADNADGNGEVFLATYNGATLTNLREVTRTKAPSLSTVVNALNFGRRISRNGNLIAFESISQDPSANNTTSANAPAVFIYNVTANSFVLAVPRASDTEVTNGQGDIPRFPTFTGDSSRLVFASTLNIKADGTRVDVSDATGLNPTRIIQLFTEPVPASSSATLVVTRLTNIQASNILAAVTPLMQFAVSNTIARIAFSLPFAELGGGNSDQSTEAYYLVTPPAPETSDTDANTSALAYFTGLSRNQVATPTASPTPTPSPTPTATPLAGLAPGMRAVVQTTTQSGSVTFSATSQTVSCTPPSVNCDAASESHRAPSLPFELNGVSLSIANASAGISFVSQNEIDFLVPKGLAPTTGTATVPVVINIRESGGVRTIRSLLQIVAVQPDIGTSSNGPDGRAMVSNVTNPLLSMGTAEPFTVTTTYVDSSTMPPTTVTAQTKLRLILTGVRGVPVSGVTVRLVKVSDNTATDITGSQVTALMATDTPGLFQLDFLLPASLAGAGDVAVIVIANGAQSRAADTAPRFRIN